MDVADLNIIELFAGHGMLGEGVRIARPGARVLGYIEREAYAAACLMARMEDKALEPAPVFCGDISDVRGCEFIGINNLWLVGGFPCQDISVAGRGAGIAQGTRSGLWFEYARIIKESNCAGVFIENVAALVTRGLDIVLGDLAALGFDAEWGVFSAEGVGAPHKRERVFIMAHRAAGGLRVSGQSPAGDGLADGGDEELADAHPAQRRGQDEGREALGRVPVGGASARSDEAMADAAHDHGRGRIGGTQTGAGPGTSGRRGFAGGDTGVGNAESQRRQGRRNDRSLPDQRLPFPPGPEDRDAWAGIIERSPHLAPAVEPGLRVLVDGVALVVDESRADQLRGTGNGVVAVTAAVAFSVLAARLGL